LNSLEIPPVENSHPTYSSEDEEEKDETFPLEHFEDISEQA